MNRRSRLKGPLQTDQLPWTSSWASKVHAAGHRRWARAALARILPLCHACGRPDAHPSPPRPAAGKDFVMLCSDTSAVHSIITIKQDEDKIVPVDSHKVFCIAGEAGDRVQFSDYIIANVKLYALRNATELSTKSVAHYARGELAAALRKVSRGGEGEGGRLGAAFPGGARGLGQLRGRSTWSRAFWNQLASLAALGAAAATDGVCWGGAFVAGAAAAAAAY